LPALRFDVFHARAEFKHAPSRRDNENVPLALSR
jgi:hypothetical protein